MTADDLLSKVSIDPDIKSGKVRECVSMDNSIYMNNLFIVRMCNNKKTHSNSPLGSAMTSVLESIYSDEVFDWLFSELHGWFQKENATEENDQSVNSLQIIWMIKNWTCS